MRAVSTAASVVRHTLGVSLQALLVFAIIAAIALALSPVYKPADFLAGTGSVAAARPASGAISVPDGVFAGTTTATVNPGGSGAWAFIECHQGGTLVLRQYRSVDANNQATFQLGPTPVWSSGSADCIAEEGTWARNGSWRVIASTTFHVAG